MDNALSELYARARKFGWTVNKEVRRENVTPNIVLVHIEYEAHDARGRCRAMYSTHSAHNAAGGVEK